MRKTGWRSFLRFQTGSVLMILCGGILAFFPDSASVLLSAVLGWLLIAAGVALVIAGTAAGLALVTVIQGACFLLAGAWLHRHPLMLASVLGFVLGLLALRQGWRKGQRAMRKKLYGSFWIWDAGMAALELLAGLVLIFVPLSLSRLIGMLAGIFMVLCGVADLLAFRKNGGGFQGYVNIIDADE